MIQRISNLFLGKNTLVNKKNTQRPSFTATEQIESVSKIPMPTLLAYMNGKTNSNLTVSYSNFSILNIPQLHKEKALDSINDLNKRVSEPHKTGQVLNWINILPKEQLARLDDIYKLAESAKQNGGKKLGIIGIGGSKHTIENMLSLNKLTDNVEFLSAVDPDSMEHFTKKLGDLKDVTIMVASKSGTTLEPSIGYDFVEKIFVEYFKNDFLKQGFNEEEALQKAQAESAKHFICITDKDATKSKLRQIANEKGYQCGIIHDECGGRFGAFDDHTLTALAWCGLPKDEMKKMLESSLKAQKKFLSSDLTENTAMQRALFNTKCVLEGKLNQHDYYFGDSFQGTRYWNTQMKKESHKSLYKVSADLIGPEFLHNSTESDLDSGDKTSFYTFTKLKNDRSEKFKSYNALIDGAYIAYSQRHPVSVIELNNLSLEAIGEFVELKHFETLYTGMLLRALKNGETSIPDVLPEVIQPNVGIYKAEVNKILGK